MLMKSFLFFPSTCISNRKIQAGVKAAIADAFTKLVITGFEWSNLILLTTMAEFIADTGLLFL